jgi:hypothetical protein
LDPCNMADTEDDSLTQLEPSYLRDEFREQFGEGSEELDLFREHWRQFGEQFKERLIPRAI